MICNIKQRWRCLWLTICGLIMVTGLIGQNTTLPRYIAELGVHSGYIMKHSGNLIPDITEPSYFAELGLLKIRGGSKPWHQHLKYPGVGGSLLLATFGDRHIFGRAVAVYPHISFYPVRRNAWGIYLRIGAGIAYLSHKYHPVDQPDNNAISTHLNNITQFKAGCYAHLNQQYRLSAQASLTHFSNGKYKSPNLGINIPSIGITIEKKIGKHPITDVQPNAEKESIQKHHLFYRFGFGIHNIGLGGPRHPVYTHTLVYARQTSAFNRIWLGTTWAFDRAKYRYLVLDEWYDPPIPKKYASDWSVLIGNEILAGNVGLYLMAGYYVYQPTFASGPMYIKFGMQYYIWNPTENSSLFLYTNIKSHNFTADYFEFGVGWKL